MQKKREHKKWRECPNCNLLVFTSSGLGNHTCPDKVIAKRDMELDLVVGAEMETWDEDVRQFWNKKETQFYEWLAEHRRF